MLYNIDMNHISIKIVFIKLMILSVIACGEDSNSSSTETPNTTPTTTDTPEATSSPSEILNLQQITTATGSDQLHASGLGCNGAEIAIFDDGFMGLGDAAGKTLPAGLSLEPYSGSNPQDIEHGLIIAQLVWSTCTGKKYYDPNIPGPKLRLYNVNGLDNFKNALTSVMEKNIRYVVHSRVYEFGGNLKGEGYFNTLVNQYLDHHSSNRWFNAAGNYHKRFYTNILQASSSDVNYITLPHEGKFTKLVVSEAGPLKIVSSWENQQQSLENSLGLGLQLEIYTDNKVLFDTSKAGPATSNSFQNPYHFTTLQTYVEPGTYWIALKRKNNSTIPQLTFHIAVNHHAAEFQNYVRYNSSVVVIADNPKVITIGANDYENSSFGGGKPDFLSISQTKLEGINDIYSSSTANAIGAASWILYEQYLKSHNVQATKDQILNKITTRRQDTGFKELSLLTTLQ